MHVNALTLKVACVYDVTGECKGMLTPKRLNILYKAFHDTKLAGIHDTIMHPPKSFASELLRPHSCSTLHNNKTPMNTKVKHSYMCALPSAFTLPSRNGHFTQENWPLLLTTTLNISISGARPSRQSLGDIPNAFSSKFLCLPSCV